MQEIAIIYLLYFQEFMTFLFAIFVKWSCAGKGQKYAFIFMGNRRRVWYNKNAHVCPETAYSAIIA